MTRCSRLATVLAALVCAVPCLGFERWYMYEEWYDWHPRPAFRPQADGSLEVEVHFVGPGAVTPRGIYVRGPATAALEQIGVQAITDHQGRPLAADPQPVEVAGMPPDRRWVRLARGAFARGYRRLVLRLPPGTDFDFVCLSPNERYLTDGRAEGWIRDFQRGKEVRCGLPLGGIGAGKVEIARDGRLRNLTIHNNIDAPFYHPEGCFLAAWIDGRARVLRDDPVAGLPAVGSIGFRGRYPFAELSCGDPDWPTRVEVRAWSPICPGNIEDSSLPVAIFEFTFVNPTGRPLPVAAAVSWENLLGSTGRPQPVNLWNATGHYVRVREDDGNTQKALVHERLAGLRFDGGPKREPDAEGNCTLAVPADGPYRVSVATCADPAAESPAWQGFAREGVFPPGPQRGGPGCAALAIRAEVPAGGRITIPVVFTWHMDHFFQMGAEDLGHYYARRLADSTAVADYVLRNRDRLAAEARALGELFDAGDLPAWFAEMLLNDLYVLSTGTWLTRDGRFSVNEGPTNMYGVMGTMDQKLYASAHLALLFPALQMRELRHFGELANPNGGITHDLGAGLFADRLEAFDWPDLCSAFSLLSWQVYRYTADRAFWDGIRPKVRRAIECLAGAWDPEGLGVPGRGSTFDDEDSYRIFSYTAGLWLCDLRLGMRLAAETGDEAFAAWCRERFDRARALVMEHLWTGRYFRYGASPPPEDKRTDASHFSQTGGEFWARLVDLEPLFDESVRRSALAGTLALHWNERFRLPPKIVMPDGSLFPRDAAHRNAPVSWPMHARALMCGAAFQGGMAREGWSLLEAMQRNITAANGPDPWDQSLYYDPITARLDWGVFYMSAPASWLAYMALLDTWYDAVESRLIVRPDAAAVVPGRLPVITPVFWGLLEVSSGGRPVALEVRRTFRDAAAVGSIRLSGPAAGRRIVAPDPLPASAEGDLLRLHHPVPLRPGLVLRFVDR